MRRYFIGLLLCVSVSIVFGDNSVNGHEMDLKRIPSEAPVQPLDAPPYCTVNQAKTYVKQACGVYNAAASCSDGQKMVDCAEKELRNKCGKEMVQEVCDNLLPEFLKHIHSSCSLTCSANSHFIIGSIAALSFLKIFLKYFF